MHDSFLSVAGIRIRLQAEQPLTADASFAPFLTEPASPDVLAVYSCVDALPEMPEKILYRDSVQRVCRKENGELIRFFFEGPAADRPYGAAWEESGCLSRVVYLPEGRRFVSEFGNSFYHLGIEKLLIRFERLCFHAACVETPLGGILFSGPSGIGKSTQAQLWCRFRGARQINGDRPALSRDGNGWRAWGSPYAGSSRVYVNDSCPVRAIVMLRQDSCCALRRLGIREAFRAVWQGVTVHSWDRSYMETASALALDLTGAVPVFEFGCTPDAAAVDFLERELRKELDL